MLIEIKNRFNGNVIFSHDTTKNTMAITLVMAIASGANLYEADLRGANLRGADLRGANLRGANLRECKGAELVIAQTRIVGEGDIIGYKKCMNNVIVKLLIPANAKRSHAFGRKCRAEYVKVLEVLYADGSPAEKGISLHDGKTTYVVGEIVRPDSFCENWMEECAPGIHFFITRIEAENYN